MCFRLFYLLEILIRTSRQHEKATPIAKSNNICRWYSRYKHFLICALTNFAQINWGERFFLIEYHNYHWNCWNLSIVTKLWHIYAHTIEWRTWGLIHIFKLHNVGLIWINQFPYQYEHCSVLNLIKVIHLVVMDQEGYSLDRIGMPSHRHCPPYSFLKTRGIFF